ncbi:Firmicu-CTERM sorting domain-containing protein [Leuconostoc holzapfelii]|uniref:Firmicu-CTERM sorting domain-containing protein n=1 Tax=Leuconostoc holzapfelii TaxID=434464 RepID=A0ABT2NT69_9LACO|nr:Firmicu-CTERM sorting domain-containing protein [Leuconostoc holzapfelii]MCT8388573.1 Firmicu-CTERM sorting domain-containing protein [Leuconostoc holzapfelii]
MNVLRKILIIGFFTIFVVFGFHLQKVSANGSGIVIDGNYNDWNGQYQKVQANSDAQRNVGIWADQNNIYFYMDSAPDFGHNNQGNDNSTYLNTDFTIQVGGQTYVVGSGRGFMDQSIRNFESSPTNASTSFDIKYWAYTAANHYTPQVVGKALATHVVKGNHSDNIFEAAIPMKALGITTIPENTPIAISNPSIWRGTVSINYAGAPTGPWVLVGIGVIFAAVGVIWQIRGTKKTTIHEMEVVHA